MRHCAFVHTHTLPAHLQIFTLLFYCVSLLRDLCVCIEILRINKVYMQRWMATNALLFLMAWEHLMFFFCFFYKGNKSIVRLVQWHQKEFEQKRYVRYQLGHSYLSLTQLQKCHKGQFADAIWLDVLSHRIAFIHFECVLCV